MSKAYIAGPFFNPGQIKIIEDIKAELKAYGHSFFSPKDESMFKQGDDPKVILDLNCNAILSCDMIIVVTDGKDVGTMFEAGYAYSHQIPTLYVWLSRQPSQKFNLMLVASGEAVYSIDAIGPAINHYYYHGEFTGADYDGDIE